MFTRIFSGIATPQNISLWNNYKQAYIELEKDGLLSIENTNKQKMKETINEFIRKVEDEYLVPLNSLADIITEKKKNGKTSIEVDYVGYMHLIDKYYNINNRDFFKSSKSIYKNYSEKLNLSIEECEKHANLSPVDSLISAKIRILHDIEEEKNGMPYVDFWHHLMNKNFPDVVNGCRVDLWNDTETYENKNDDIGIIFRKIKEVLFKEISQYPFFNGEKPEKIEFHICW